ncbi:MAG: hypothetical protein U0172_03925 [Nitrospiraceae bacterium]
MPAEVVFGAWIATGLTLCILTFLYQDNPLFKAAEHLYVGVSVGYEIVKVFDTVVVRLIVEPIATHGEWLLLVPVFMGLLMLTRYVPKVAWLSRYAFAFLVGTGAGLAIPRTISSFILKQIEDTIRPLLSRAGDGSLSFTYDLLNPASTINAVVILVGVASVLFYFLFTVQHTGPGKVVARMGILFLMISFGAAFGYTVMARMSLLIGRLTDLIEYSQPTYHYATLWLSAATIGTLAYWRFGKKGQPPTH